jgi:hypothetical protein
MATLFMRCHGKSGIDLGAIAPHIGCPGVYNARRLGMDGLAVARRRCGAVFANILMVNHDKGLD